jgi:hypothetical protein
MTGVNPLGLTQRKALLSSRAAPLAVPPQGNAAHVDAKRLAAAVATISTAAMKAFLTGLKLM